jgi:hypothetical protein
MLNPLQLPESTLPVYRQFITCEFASLTAKREPITYPLTPYVSADGRTLDVSTGVTYPAKAERARRNPQVALLYSYPQGSGLQAAPTVLVYGHAAVRDQDLQANMDRYVRELQARDFMPPLPPWILRRIGWYFARMWIEITPQRVLWWEAGKLDLAPHEWTAPTDLVLPASDPAPQGAQPPRWKDTPTDWRPRAAYAAQNLGAPVLTVVDAAGYPVPYRVKHARVTGKGFALELPAYLPAPAQGSACLTFHNHPEKFTGQENMVFMGSVNGDAFTVDRCPGDWSLPTRGLASVFAFFGNGFKLAPRLQAEAARRGQAVPKVKL